MGTNKALFSSFAVRWSRPVIAAEWRCRQSSFVRQVGIPGVVVEGIAYRLWLLHQVRPDLHAILVDNLSFCPMPLPVRPGYGKFCQLVTVTNSQPFAYFCESEDHL